MYILLIVTKRGKCITLTFETLDSLLTSFDLWVADGGISRNAVDSVCYIQLGRKLKIYSLDIERR